MRPKTRTETVLTYVTTAVLSFAAAIFIADLTWPKAPEVTVPPRTEVMAICRGLDDNSPALDLCYDLAWAMELEDR